MRFHAALAEQPDAAVAAAALADALASALPGTAPDLLVLFVAGGHAEHAGSIAAHLRRELAPGVLVGVTAEGVAAGEREVERRPALAALAAVLPGVALRPFHIGRAEWRTLLADDERLQQRTGTGEEHRAQLLLADPFTTPIDAFLARLDRTLQTPTFGGMASAAQMPGGNTLLLDRNAFHDGVVGLGLGGALRVETVVSQGCRPLGEPLVATRVEDTSVLELGRRPALTVVEELLGRLEPAELSLVRKGGLFVGVAISEYVHQFRRGDFLVRGLMGVDRTSGALVVGDHLRAGQTVQFHARDAATADEDLRELLGAHARRGEVAGALLFTCNGRGTRLFPEPHHDARVTRELLPGVPLAGFFAMGELGPVGGRSFVHGHTASLALFRPPAL
jgi:small ligand-binding sensory domain FIST